MRIQAARIGLSWLPSAHKVGSTALPQRVCQIADISRPKSVVMVRCVCFESILENPTIGFEADLRYKVIAQVQSGRDHESFAWLLTFDSLPCHTSPGSPVSELLPKAGPSVPWGWEGSC